MILFQRFKNVKTILNLQALQKQAVGWFGPIDPDLPPWLKGCWQSSGSLGAKIQLSIARPQGAPAVKAEVVSGCAWTRPLPPGCLCPEPTQKCRPFYSLSLRGKGLLAHCTVQHRAWRGWSDHLGREKKPRLVGETIIFWAVLKPVSNIVIAYAKIRPLLTSKMNN